MTEEELAMLLDKWATNIANLYRQFTPPDSKIEPVRNCLAGFLMDFQQLQRKAEHRIQQQPEQG